MKVNVKGIFFRKAFFLKQTRSKKVFDLPSYLKTDFSVFCISLSLLLKIC